MKLEELQAAFEKHCLNGNSKSYFIELSLSKKPDGTYKHLQADFELYVAGFNLAAEEVANIRKATAAIMESENKKTRVILELREQLANARAAVQANHEWHEAHEGYSGSDLFNQNILALR